MSYSFAKDTLVLTKTGYKLINEIKVGELVLTHKGRFMPVLQTFGHLGNIYSVSFNGLNSIKVSGNHLFFVKETKYSNPILKEVKDIKKTDYLYMFSYNLMTMFFNTKGTVFSEYKKWLYNFKKYNYYFTDGNIICFHAKEIFNLYEDDFVYDIIVDTDHSFIANNILVYDS